MTSVCIVMPAYNEAEGIEQFLRELSESFSSWDRSFIVVNDCSKDQTSAVVTALKDSGFPVTLMENSINSGHGPSTLNALRAGLASGADVVIATDGDGQFLGAQVRVIADALISNKADVVEGVRTSRTDPGYRKITTLTTRGLVWSKVRQLPRDANTPLRVYSSGALVRILPLLPERSMTPNLLISAVTRRGNFRFLEIPVTAIPRRGVSEVGTSWGRGSVLPSRRFIRFCAGAAKEWFTTSGR